MTELEAIRERHSVRVFKDLPFDRATVSALRKAAEKCNKEGGMRFQLIVNEPEAFQADRQSYGSFQNCRNYIALVAPRGKDEQVGYYGEKFVLAAQTLGVNSCWVALTYKKGKTDVRVGAGEKLYMVIALGYGENHGHARKSKAPADVSDITDDAPQWYRDGIEAALLAPTAVNQQKFRFERDGDAVTAKAGFGVYAKVDLGIVKYHFEVGAGKENFRWA